CDHSWVPSEARISCAVTRARSPSRRTLPSSRLATPSRAPMVRESTSLPLNWNDEVRPITRRPSMRASELRISSDRPSEKNTLSLSSDRFSNGSTAMDLARMLWLAVGEAAMEADVAPTSWLTDAVLFAAATPMLLPATETTGARAYRHSRPPPTASSRVMISSSVPLTRCAPRSPWYHASTSTTKNPSTSASVMPRRTSSGQPNCWATTSAPWIRANANATYATAHCTSLRCFRRAMKSVMELSALCKRGGGSSVRRGAEARQACSFRGRIVAWRGLGFRSEEDVRFLPGGGGHDRLLHALSQSVKWFSGATGPHRCLGQRLPERAIIQAGETHGNASQAAPASSRSTLGCVDSTRNNVRAAPVGSRRPCSQSCNVR